MRGSSRNNTGAQGSHLNSQMVSSRNQFPKHKLEENRSSSVMSCRSKGTKRNGRSKKEQARVSSRLSQRKERGRTRDDSRRSGGVLHIESHRSNSGNLRKYNKIGKLKVGDPRQQATGRYHKTQKSNQDLPLDT